jgi:hypothetical protein
VKFITLNNKGNKVLKSIPTKTIVFNVFDIANSKDLIIRCPYDGKVVKINASTNSVGTIDTELIVEKINKSDYKNQVNNWSNILSSDIFIRLGQVTDDESYIINNNLVDKDDYFRVGLIGNSDLKNLNLEIEIEVI